MFNVFCPKVIMETAPKEIAGFAGSTFQLMLTLGIGANAIVAYFFTSEAFESDQAKTAFIVFNAIPLAFSVVLMLFLTCVFTQDTPIVMARMGHEEELNDFMKKLYSNPVVAQ